MITIVSGLPRSGTSLMMRILEEAGYTIHDDGQRTPDEHNPYGYYEDLRANTLQHDNRWIGECEGGAVKVTSYQLPYLPPEHEYDIIYMTRNVKEIIQSQDKMIGEPHPEWLCDKYIMHVIDTLDSLIGKRHIVVDYNELMNNSEPELRKLLIHLNTDIPVEKIIHVVDKTLWRNRV